MHVFYTSAFLWLGYKAHLYEVRADENYEEMVKKHKNVPWWPRAQLLAERAERLKAEKEGTGSFDLVFNAIIHVVFSP